MLSPGAAGESAGSTQLLREARAAAALNHPHACTIYEVGEVEGQAFIAMELIEGEALDAIIAAGDVPANQVVRYGLQIADVRFDRDGRMTTLAGVAGRTGFAGDGGPALEATLNMGYAQSSGLAIDDQGNVYFVDGGNRRVRAIRAGAR